MPKPLAINPAWARTARSALSAMLMTARAQELFFGVAGVSAALALCPSPLTGLCAALWWIAVVVIISSDIARFIIPDTASAAIATFGTLSIVITGLWEGEPPAAVGLGLAEACLMGICGFGLFLAVARLYRGARGREGLGFGDVKLAGASAIWLTPGEAAMAVEIAALGALALVLAGRRRDGWRDDAVPFGAFLAPAAWLVFVLHPALASLLDGF